MPTKFSNESIRSPSSSPTFGGIFEQGELERELSEIDHQMQGAGFWDNPAKNASILQKRRDIERRLETLNRLRADADELATWRELLNEGEADPEFDRFIDRLSSELGKLELDFKLSGPDDDKNALLAIHPGAGGTESQDWAEMLLRMYLRWAERRGYPVDIIDIQAGEEAGIKGVTFTVHGQYAYGR
ncbi:MAG TPA: PCRF domain-containing protein, partial [Thermoanaerobaculia bacterium]|nr:PCRF domain-containing protein [Thermoanaerobaculia bacterium]